MKQFQTSFGKMLSFALIILFSCLGKNAWAQQTDTSTKQRLKYVAELERRDHYLSADSANAWIQRYKNNKDSICNNILGSTFNVLPVSSESFNIRFINKIVNLKNCIGVRVFLGINDSNQVCMILGGIGPLGNTLYITPNGSDKRTYTPARSAQTKKPGAVPALPLLPAKAGATPPGTGLVEMGIKP